MSSPPHDQKSLEEKVARSQARFKLPPGAREIILVRHGATLREDVRLELDGKSVTNPPLSPDGEVQAQAVTARLAAEPITHIFVTPLQRTHQTAAPLATLKGLAPVVIPEMREIHLGDWEHELHVRIASGDPAFQRAWNEENWSHIPNAENIDEITARVRAGIAKILAAMEPDSVAVAFSHGVAIATTCHVATGSRPFAFLAIENTGVSRLIVQKDGRWMLRAFNDVSHLAPA